MPKRKPPIPVKEIKTIAEYLSHRVLGLAVEIQNLRASGVQGIEPTTLTEIQEALILVTRDASNAVVILSGAIETAIHHEEIQALSHERAVRRTGKDN